MKRFFQHVGAVFVWISAIRLAQASLPDLGGEERMQSHALQALRRRAAFQEISRDAAELRSRLDRFDVEGCIRALDRILARGKNADAYEVRGLMRSLSGESKLALEDFNRAIAIRPHSAEFLEERGKIRQDLADFTGALDDLNKAVELEPKNPEWLLDRADIRHAQGDDQGASADIEAALALDPRRSDTYLRRSEMRQNLGDAKGAAEDANHVLATEPDNPEALVERAHTKEALEDFSGAMEDLTKCIGIRPDFEDAYLYRALLEYVLGQDEAAMRDLDQTLKLFPPYICAYWLRGGAKRRLGDLRGSMTDLDRALKRYPENADILVERGLTFFAQHDWPAALADFIKADKLGDADQGTTILIVLAHLKSGEKASAEALLRSALLKEDGDRWQRILYSFLLGRIGEPDLVVAAHSKDKETNRKLQCQAWYYAGLRRLETGDKETAIRYFHEARFWKQTAVLEYGFAGVELELLGEK